MKEDLNHRRHYRAPGRVNLIGEHTDYNHGYVLPVALGQECRIQSRAATGKCLSASSSAYEDNDLWEVDSILTQKPTGRWTDYVLGVAHELASAGFPIEPQHLAVDSTVPEGAGLSSSASLEVAVALALLDSKSVDPAELALLCQRAENQFVGMPCGVMDQFISVFGKKDCALLLDCHDLSHRHVPLPANVAIVAINSMVKHQLAQTEYRHRRADCHAAVAMIKLDQPSVDSLRDVGPSSLPALQSRLAPYLYRRVEHVVTENQRVLDFVDAAEAGDLQRMGHLFFESHESLRSKYEVSCPELDILVETAASQSGVYGARMTGGGFGGCTVNLIEAEQVDRAVNAIQDAFESATGTRPEAYVCQPSDGASLIPSLVSAREA